MRDNFIVPYPNKLFVELSTTMLYDGRYLFAGYYSGAFCTCKGEGGGGGGVGVRVTQRVRVGVRVRVRDCYNKKKNKENITNRMAKFHLREVRVV